MRPRFRIALASVLAVVGSACASGGGAGGGGAARPAALDLAEGEQPVENGQTREAARQLGIAVIQTGDAARAAYQAAATAAQGAIAGDPRNPLPWKQAGEAYIGLKDYAKADSLLDQAETLRPRYKIEIDPMREQAWIGIYNEGADLLNQGPAAYRDVVALFEQANVIFDQRPEIMALTGQIQLELGDTNPAIENLRKAMAIIQSDRINQMDSLTADLWREQAQDIPPVLAQAYISAQRYDDAVATIRPMLEADPSNATYARALAGVYAQMNQPDSVRAVYQRMERAAAGNLTPYDYQVIGLGYYDLEEWLQAAASLESALRLAPRDRDAAEWRARSLYYYVQDQAANADRAVVEQLVAAAQTWIEMDPNNSNAYTMLATGVNTMAPGDPRVSQAIQAHDALQVHVDNLQMRRERNGGATVVGDLRNVSLPAGQNLTVRFTFYGANGSALGTQDVQLRLGAAGVAEALDVQFRSEQAVEGYTYQVMGM